MALLLGFSWSSYTYYAGHIFTIIQTEMEVCYKWLWDFKITKMPSDNPETRLEKNSLKLFQNSLSALYGFQWEVWSQIFGTWGREACLELSQTSAMKFFGKSFNHF